MQRPASTGLALDCHGGVAGTTLANRECCECPGCSNGRCAIGMVRHRNGVVSDKEVGWCLRPSPPRFSVGRARMPNGDKRTSPKRRYPGFSEKVIPIALGIIIVAIVVLLIIILSVALGLFSAAG